MYGKRLKELREDKDLLQKDIAAILNISTSAYGYYELERGEPDINSLMILSKFHDVSVDYIIGLTNIKNPKYPILHLSDCEELREFSKEAIKEVQYFIDLVKYKYKKD